MTMALVLDLIADSGKTVSEEMSLLPPSYTTKDKVACSKGEAAKIISQLKKEHKNHDTTDGIKLVFDESNWIMIRPSGTEPIARIYAEASSEEKLHTLMSKYTKKVNSILDR
jgi:phosphomannomutase/phosphoglucomutase